MNKFRVARSAGIVGMVGGVVQVVYGLLAAWFPYGPNIYHGWDEALWLVAGLGMVATVSGLLILDLGRPRWLALGSGTVAILGLLVRAIASILIIFRASSSLSVVIPVTVLVVLISMFTLGISVLRGKRLGGWRAWAPLFVPISGFFVSAVFSINLYLHFILLGFWGIAWILVAYVLIGHVSTQENAAALTEKPAAAL